MSAVDAGYGLWGLALANALFFICFAACYSRPATRTDWQLLAAFAVLVSMHFIERYGVPFSLHVLSAWLPSVAAVIDTSPHAAGHLWPLLTSETAHPHVNLAHLAGYGFVLGGFGVLALASHALDDAQRAGGLAVAGPYRWVRHPQTAALGLIACGLLLQLPTAPTLALLPLMVAMARRTAQADEEDLQLQFGLAYAEYASGTPAFVPALRRLRLSLSRRRCEGHA